MQKEQVLQEVINENFERLSLLWKKYGVKDVPSVKSAEQAYNKHGQRFMTSFVEIITPKEFSNSIPPADPTGVTPTNSGSGGGFWEGLGSVFNFLSENQSQISGIIGNFQNTPSPQTPIIQKEYVPIETKKQDYTPIIIGGFGFILVILILILVIKK